MSVLASITFMAAAVVVLATVRMATLVPGFDDDSVRPMSHAVIALGAGVVILAVTLLLGASFTLWVRVPASVMVASWGITLILVARAALPARHAASRTRAIGMPGVRRR